MKQVFHDFFLKLQSHRRTQASAALALTIVALFFVLDAKPNRSVGANFRPNQQPQDFSDLRLKGDEALNDLAEYFGSGIDENRKLAEKNQTQIAELRADMNVFQQRMVDVIKKVLERDSALTNMRPPTDSYVAPIEPQSESEMPAAIDTSAGMEEFGELQGEFAVPPHRPADDRVARVSAGDRVRVRLDTGINANADGTPYPVVFHFISDVYGPNGSVLPLGEAYLIAAAQASLSDSRVLFRLVSLSVQLPNGRRKEIDVDGWIAGEDSIRGMAGVSFDPLGQKLGAAVLAGGIQGISSGIEGAQYTTTSNINGIQKVFTGSLATAAGASGLNAGADMWTDFIKKRIELYPPHVQVLAGRDATAVFAESFSVKGLFEALNEDDQSFDEFD